MLSARTAVLSAALALGLATAADATIQPAPIAKDGSMIVRVAEGCGPGRWRGPNGGCHPFVVGHRCPPGYHIGPEGRRCWPN